MENVHGDGQSGKSPKTQDSERDAARAVGLRKRTMVPAIELADCEHELRTLRHRIRNNLQLVLSLTRLEAQFCTDSASCSLFSELRDRVHTAVLMQELVLEYAGAECFDLAKCVRDLLQNVGNAHPDLGLSTELEPVSADADLAAPFGLLANELFSMALRALPGRGVKREIFIGLSQRPSGDVCLTIRTDSLLLHSTPSTGASALGRRFVDLLVRQLAAELHEARGASGIELQLILPMSTLKRGTRPETLHPSRA